MGIKRWFEHRAQAQLPPSPLVPLAEHVQQQAAELHQTTVQLNKMIAAREAKDEPRP